MSTQDDFKQESSTHSLDPEPLGRWQFGLKHLFLLQTAVAIFLAIFTGLYPFSIHGLPFLLVPLVLLTMTGFLQRSLGHATKGVAAALAIYLAGTWLATGYVDPSEPTRRSSCANNLKGIVLALHGYHNAHGCLPPAYIADEHAARATPGPADDLRRRVR